MNIQQLKYVTAVGRFRNFARAAESCNVSQPTLSAIFQKLEEELGIRIFERTNRSVNPTSAGEKIIRQAEHVLMEIERINEIVSEDKGLVGGRLRLSVGPTIAPYVQPKFIRHYREDYPTVELSIQEMDVGHHADRSSAWRTRCGHRHIRQQKGGDTRDPALYREVHGVPCGELLAKTARVQTGESGA